MKSRTAITGSAVALLALVARLSWSQAQETEKKPEPQTVTRDEVVVVTAFRSETNLVDAPAAMSLWCFRRRSGCNLQPGSAGMMATILERFGAPEPVVPF